MFIRRYSLSIVVALIAALALAGCAGSGTKGDDPQAQGPRLPAYFEEIPADTFFFVGGSQPIPRELVASTLDKAEAARQLLDEFGNSLEDEMKYSYEEFEQQVELPAEESAGAEDGAEEEPTNWLLAQMGGEITVEGLEKLGVSANPRVAAYAVGTIPVLRFELHDATKFGEFVSAAEAEADVSTVDLEHRGVTYRRYSEPEADEFVLLRFNDDEAVLAVVPVDVAEAFLPYFVGVEKPQKSMADDNIFAQVADKHGFESFAAGYFDLESVLAYSAGEREFAGVTKQFLDLSKFEDDSSDVCKQEYLRLGRMMPRLVGGYRHYDDQLTDFAFGAELEESLAQGLAATVAGAPGHETEFAQSSLLEVGFGINVGKMIDFMSERARDIQSQPFECPELQEMNQLVIDMQRTSGQIPPAVRKLAGFNLLLRNVLLERQNIDGVSDTIVIPRALGVLRTDEPEGFMFLVSQFFPMAQDLKPRPDGRPVPVPHASDAYEGIVDPSLLMTGRGLAMSIGPKMTDPSKATLDAEEGVASPAMIFRVNLGDPAREFIADVRKLIDQAEGQLEERSLTQEDIEAARRAIAVLEDALPDGAWTAAVTSEFSNYGVLFSYRDRGPVLDLSWIDKMDDRSDADFEALDRVLGKEPPAVDEEVATESPAEAVEPQGAPTEAPAVEKTPQKMRR